MQFPFNEFAPDAGETVAGNLMQAQGVQPIAQGYGPASSLTTPASAGALAASCLGLISMYQRDGTNLVFAFTSTSVYQLQADYTWSSAIASSFNCTAGDHWSLAQLGDKLLATNTTDGLQAYDIESPAGFSAITAAGSPREIFVVANTVVALDCLDDAAARDNRLIRSSAIGDQTTWSGPGTDYQPLEDGGSLVGGVGLKNNAGVIFQTDTMRLIQFGTGAGAFALTKIAEGRGSVGRRSITGLDGAVYWLSTDGFKRFTLANGIEHIGAGKIDTWFFDRVDQSKLTEVQGALDPLNKLVLWRYPSTSINSATVFDDIIGYSWQFNRWFYWSEQTTYLSRIATPGYNTDSMDDFGPIDSIDIPVDSRFWQGGQPVMAALDENLKYATFSGSNYAATLESFVSNSPVTGLINFATPVDDSPDGTLALGVRDQLSDSTTWKTGTAKGDSGRTPQRGRGLNIAWRRSIDAASSWSYARGVDHIKAATGGPK